MVKKPKVVIAKPQEGITVEGILEDIVTEARLTSTEHTWYPEDYSANAGKLGYIRDLYYHITGESLRINGALV